MKIRKSTIILLIAIIITISLGALAVFTANLLQKRRVAKEKAKAEEEVQCPLSFRVDQSKTGVSEDGKKFRVTILAENKRSQGKIYIKLKTYISQCMKQGTNFCAEKLLLGAHTADWKEATIDAGKSYTFTFEANSAAPEKCGRFQYDVSLLDAKERDENGSRIEECNKDYWVATQYKWVATQIIDTGSDCNACFISSSSNTIRAGETVILEATAYAGGKLTPNTPNAWTADISSDESFNPTSGMSTKYTAPTSIPENVETINITFKGAWESFPETASPTYGGAYNSLKSPDTIYFLPGVAHNKGPTENSPITFDKTNIYIFNPNSTQTSVEAWFNGTSNTSRVVNIDPYGTSVLTTQQVFGSTTSFYGTVEVRANHPVIATYEKIDKDSKRSFTMEGIPYNAEAATVFHSPVTTRTINWGVNNHFITIYNPNNSKISLQYHFYYNDGYETPPREDPTQLKSSLSPYETYTFDVNDIVPSEDPRNPNNEYWWTGWVKIEANANIVSISEDVGIAGSAGSIGDYGRGRSHLYQPSTRLCLMPLVNNTYGIEKTGFAFSNTTENPTNVQIQYFSSFTGKKVKDPETVTLQAHAGYTRDTKWAELPDDFFGAAIVQGEHGLVGAIQDLSTNHTYGRTVVGIPCDSDKLTNKVYLTGLLAGAYGTTANSIQVFNPSDTEVVTGTITLYGRGGTADATFDFYLKPHAMDGPILWAILPPGWYGSAVIEANGKIVATSLSHSGSLITGERSCTIPLRVERGPSGFSCTLTASDETVQKGGQVTVELMVTDSDSSGHTYTYSLADNPDSGSFDPTEDSVTPGQAVTSTYTVSSTANDGTVELSATVKKGGTKLSTQCTDTITITSGPVGQLDCTNVTVSDSTPNRNQTITAQAVVTNNTGQPVSYLWTDSPVSGAFNPNNQQTVQYTVGPTASGTITLTARVTAGTYSDTCSATLNVQIPGSPPPKTAFIPPVVTLFGTGGALTGIGTLLARNTRRIASIMRRFEGKSFEQRAIEAIRKRREAV